MHEYASDWLERRRVGEISEGPLADTTSDTTSDTTYQDYLWRLKKYILPSFGRTPVARISDLDCRRFRGKLFADSEAIKKIAAAGGHAEDENGRRRRGLSPRSIQMMMLLLVSVPALRARAGQDLHREERPHRLARCLRNARLRRPADRGNSRHP